MQVEKDYENLEEEVEEQRELIQILREKYRQAIQENKDLVNENYQEKEILMESLREVQQEMELYKAIVTQAFNHEEVDRIVAKS